MARLPLAFFSAAAICAFFGMVWGAFMGSTHDFTLAPAHAHLNLLGWATLALMGTFYALSGQGGRRGWINWFLSVGGVVVMTPALAMVLSGDPGAELAVVIGSILAILGMLTFLVSILATWRATLS